MKIPDHIPKSPLTKYVLAKGSIKGNGEAWFIEDIEPWDVTNEYVRLNLTNYRLPTHEKIERVLKNKVSKLRWVTLVNAEVRPGGAKGWMITGKRVFHLNYAWGGLNAKENYNRRESYSVQIAGKGCEQFINSYVKQIIREEGQKRCLGTDIGFLFLKKIKPYDLKRKGK